jgi:hypothetical protein
MIPDADLEIARTEREAYHRAVAHIQSQQLGELFANLQRQNGPERYFPEGVAPTSCTIRL